MQDYLHSLFIPYILKTTFVFFETDTLSISILNNVSLYQAIVRFDLVSTTNHTGIALVFSNDQINYVTELED